jgi:hypothetical protein
MGCKSLNQEIPVQSQESHNYKMEILKKLAIHVFEIVHPNRFRKKETNIPV